MSRPTTLPPPAASQSRSDRLLELWGDRNIDEVRFVLLDTETTGTEETAKILEVAARGWSTHPTRVYPKPYEALVNPGAGVLIPPGSSAVHHISDVKVSKAPLLEGVLPDFLRYIGDSPIVAFNSDYDQGMLKETPLGDHLWLDAYRMAMHMWSLGEKNKDGFPLTSLKQQVLRYWLGLPEIAGDAHRAGADIMLTGLVFQEIVKKYKQMGYSSRFGDFVEWVRSPILHTTIPIGSSAFLGKTPEEIETWALKKAFDPTDSMYASFQKFNIHDALQPEYSRRLGMEPAKPSAGSRRSPFRPSR